MEKEITIKLENVTKEYKMYESPTQRLVHSITKSKSSAPRIFKATEDLSFEIEKGEILGLIGKNGAGKSTILKMITGISFPTTGSIEVKGRISSLLELGAGFNPELTGIENILFQGDILGISEDEMKKRIPAILDFAEIGDFIHQPVKNYSSGMFARLAFATAINVDPDVLIVDEVLAVGDIAFQFKCIEKMKEFSAQGVTIIFVTHSMMQLYRFCQRAIWLEHGKVVMDGEVETVVPMYEDNVKQIEQDEHGVTETEFIRNVQSKLVQNKTTVNALEVRQTFNLEVTYELTKDLKEEPYFALSILKDGSNYDMFGIFPQQERYSLNKEAGTYEIIITFDVPQLNIGSYDIQFAILEKNGISHLYFGKALDFTVVGKQDSLGILDITHTVKTKKIK